MMTLYEVKLAVEEVEHKIAAAGGEKHCSIALLQKREKLQEQLAEATEYVAELERQRAANARKILEQHAAAFLAQSTPENWKALKEAERIFG